MERKAMKRPWIISVASGKGGVGKTLTTVNMAIAAQKMGFSTLILDGDMGLANVDIVLGLRARYNINDVLESRLDLDDVLIEGPHGMRIIPSGSGLAQLAELKLAQRVLLLDKIEAIADRFQVLMIDTGAGISSNVTHLNSIADLIMLVTTPEPTAMTDAYAFLKVMQEMHARKRFDLVVNQAISEAQGLKIYQSLADVSKRFIEADLRYGGTVPKDAMLERSVMLQRAGDDRMAHTRSGQAWHEITRRVLDSLEQGSSTESRNCFQDLMFPRPVLRSVNKI